jgi:DNA replication protein DnaC
MSKTIPDPTADRALEHRLDYLQLPYLKEHFRSAATEAASKHWSHLDYLDRLIEGETLARQDRAMARRIKAARFPVLKTLEAFRWDWPKKINRLQIQDLFRLRFIEEKRVFTAVAARFGGVLAIGSRGWKLRRLSG